MKKDVLENFAKFTGKHLWFAKFSKTPFLQNTSGRLLLLLAFQKQPPEVFYEKGVLEDFVKFTGKHLWFAKFSKTPLLQNTCGRLLAFLCNVCKMEYCQQCLENLR